MCVCLGAAVSVFLFDSSLDTFSAAIFWGGYGLALHWFFGGKQ